MTPPGKYQYRKNISFVFVVLGTGKNYLENICRCEMPTVLIWLGSAWTPQTRMRVKQIVN